MVVWVGLLVYHISRAGAESCAADTGTAAGAGTHMAARKAIKQILPAAPKHWVGDGFHVHPVFSNKAFSSELSPFLMFDCENVESSKFACVQAGSFSSLC